jgi:hypothetical protein
LIEFAERAEAEKAEIAMNEVLSAALRIRNTQGQQWLAGD